MSGTIGVIALLSVITSAVGYAQTDWKKQWEATVAAARKEGEVAIYGPHNPAYQQVWAIFQKGYPEIKFNFVPGKGADHVQRVVAERRAGKFLADLIMGGSSTYAGFAPGTLEPLKPLLLLPEVTDAANWFEGRFHFADRQNTSGVIISGEIGTRRGSYNTKLLDPKEVRSWWDLLNPKFKGKLVTFDPRVAGGGGETFLFFYYTPELGEKFITRLLSETDILMTRDLQQGTDWLGSGKVIFQIGSGQPVMKANKQGLPVDLMPHPLKEGEIMGGGSCCLAVLSKAPHPNAARLFVNWILSREGQIAWQKYTEVNSLRVDIPKTDLAPDDVPQKGVNYFMLNSSKYNGLEGRRAMHKIVEDALKKAGKN
ncbi:MAG: extracellular solute-binding protein [Deltaproteobacteria bacterium]|nr:extracellular solute-binding protein [Deltaproteobacteria bacterium]